MAGSPSPSALALLNYRATWSLGRRVRVAILGRGCAVVKRTPSACFPKSVGHFAIECMQIWDTAKHPYTTAWEKRRYTACPSMTMAKRVAREHTLVGNLTSTFFESRTRALIDHPASRRPPPATRWPADRPVAAARPASRQHPPGRHRRQPGGRVFLTRLPCTPSSRALLARLPCVPYALTAAPAVRPMETVARMPVPVPG